MVKEKQSVSLTDVEKKIVRDEDARLGLENFSATLRKIIREWEELKRAVPFRDPPSGCK